MQPDRDTGARIETLCGGGVAALYRGVTVYEDGRIFRIQRGPGKGRREIELHRDPKAFEDWNDRLDQAGFDQLEYDQPGNMTCSLERVRGQDRHKVSWRREQPPPEKIEAIFREIEARQKSNEDL